MNTVKLTSLAARDTWCVKKADCFQVGGLATSGATPDNGSSGSRCEYTEASVYIYFTQSFYEFLLPGHVL